MSGGGGSSGNTTTTTSSPPPEVAQAYTQLMGQANNVAGQPLNQYSGPIVAGFDPSQLQAMGTIDAAQGVAQPYINQAASYMQTAAQPINPGTFDTSTLPDAWNTNIGAGLDYNVGKYLSPYTQNVTDSLENLYNNQNQQQQQQIQGNATSRGAYGGDREAVAQALAVQQQQLAQAPTLANVRQQGFQQAQGESNTQQQLAQSAAQQQMAAYNAQQQAAIGAQEATGWLQQGAGYGLANLGLQTQQSALTGASAQLQSGALQQQLAQNQLNIPYEQFTQQQAYPFQTTGWLGNLTEGIGSNLGGNSATTTPGPSTLGQIAGAGIAGAGLVGATGGFGSDGWLSNFMSNGGGSQGGMSAFSARGGRVGYEAGGGIPDVSLSVVPPGSANSKASILPTNNIVSGGSGGGSSSGGLGLGDIFGAAGAAKNLGLFGGAAAGAEGGAAAAAAEGAAGLGAAAAGEGAADFLPLLLLQSGGRVHYGLGGQAPVMHAAAPILGDLTSTVSPSHAAPLTIAQTQPVENYAPSYDSNGFPVGMHSMAPGATAPAPNSLSLVNGVFQRGVPPAGPATAATPVAGLDPVGDIPNQVFVDNGGGGARGGRAYRFDAGGTVPTIPDLSYSYIPTTGSTGTTKGSGPPKPPAAGPAQDPIKDLGSGVGGLEKLFKDQKSKDTAASSAAAGSGDDRGGPGSAATIGANGVMDYSNDSDYARGGRSDRWDTVPGTRDNPLIQPGLGGAPVGARDVPGSQDRNRFWNEDAGIAPYNPPGVEDDRLREIARGGRAYSDGGVVDPMFAYRGYDLGGQVQQAGQITSGGASPLQSGQVSQYMQLPIEKLQEMAMRSSPNSAQGAAILHALQIKKMNPGMQAAAPAGQTAAAGQQTATPTAFSSPTSALAPGMGGYWRGGRQHFAEGGTPDEGAWVPGTTLNPASANEGAWLAGPTSSENRSDIISMPARSPAPSQDLSPGTAELLRAHGEERTRPWFERATRLGDLPSQIADPTDQRPAPESPRGPALAAVMGTPASPELMMPATEVPQAGFASAKPAPAVSPSSLQSTDAVSRGLGITPADPVIASAPGETAGLAVSPATEATVPGPAGSLGPAEAVPAATETPAPSAHAALPPAKDWIAVGDSLGGQMIDSGAARGSHMPIGEVKAKGDNPWFDTADGRSIAGTLASVKYNLGRNPDYYRGQYVRLSPGTSNSPGQIDQIQPIVDLLKGPGGAAGIQLVGVGTRAGTEPGSAYFDGNKYNPTLEALAAKNKLGWTGGIPNTVVHPSRAYWAGVPATAPTTAAESGVAVEPQAGLGDMASVKRFANQAADGTFAQAPATGDPKSYGPVATALAAEADRQHVPWSLVSRAAQIESGMGTNLGTRGNVLQLGQPEWTAIGGGDMRDLGTQARNGVAWLAKSQAEAKQALGRDPQDWESYVVHQQGTAGGPALLKAPAGESAVDALTPAYNGDRKKAMQAVIQNGGSLGMTAQEFLANTKARFEGYGGHLNLGAQLATGAGAGLGDKAISTSDITPNTPIRMGSDPDTGRPRLEARKPGFGASPWLPLVAAGFGMMASRSPHFGTAIGEGGLQGVKVAESQEAEAVKADQLRSERERHAYEYAHPSAYQSLEIQARQATDARQTQVAQNNFAHQVALEADRHTQIMANAQTAAAREQEQERHNREVEVAANAYKQFQMKQPRAAFDAAGNPISWQWNAAKGDFEVVQGTGSGRAPNTYLNPASYNSAVTARTKELSADWDKEMTNTGKPRPDFHAQALAQINNERDSFLNQRGHPAPTAPTAAPPDAAISFLKAHPDQRALFDQKYGAGASAAALGQQ